MSQENELAEAIEHVTSASASAMATDDAWDRIEELAGTLDAPDSVAAAYRQCLHADLSAEHAVVLGKRAARFHEEWYGDDRSGLAELLERVLTLSPDSEWAFQELSVVLTVAERWDDAIALYKKVIERTGNKTRRIKLLDEAYQVAKDLANRPDQAIDFLKAKLELKPSEKQLVALERLLERYERWDDLIALWRDALDDQDETTRVESLARIAETYFDKLMNGDEAHAALREVFELDKGHQPALELLEKIATTEDFGEKLRTETLDTVREVYEGSSRPQDVVRVLGDVLPLCSEPQRKALHAELGERLSQMEEHNASLEHYASLLILDPASVATQRAMRREAQLISKFDRYAAALAAAAENTNEAGRKVSLLTDAATAQLDMVDNREAAIELFLAALAVDGIKSSEVLSIGKRVNLLLEDAGRHGEHMQVLEQMADAESVPSSRRALIGDLATLAESQGEIDRALHAWQRRIEADAGDLRALDATIDILGKAERWTELIDALLARSDQNIPDNQKRSDLVRIASTYEQKLEDHEQALGAWKRVQALYGETPETIAALSRLMTHLERWSELTELLESSNAKQVDYLAEQFSSLGNAYQESLGDDVRAIECYRRALAVDLRQETAREGLKHLLEKEETRNIAAEALVHSLRSSGDSEGLLDIVEARIAGSDDRNKHAEILREAADIAQFKADDKARALGFVARLLPLTPRDRVMEDRMVSLARELEEWNACLEAYEAAEVALEGDTYAVTQMRFREAQLRDNEVGDSAGALRALLLVIAAQSDHHEAIAAVIRLAGPESRFTAMVAAVLNYAQQRDSIPEDLMTSVVTFAETNDGGWSELCSALSAHIPNSGLSKRNQAELYWRVANWQLGDLDPEGALRSLLQSVELDPNRVDTLEKLFELQNVTPDRALYKTLRRLCEIDRDELVHFTRAAELACEHLAVEEQNEALLALYTRAAGAWRGTEPANSEREPEAIVTWTIEKLVQLCLDTGEAQRALDLLIEASRLPFPQEVCLEMRNRAARIASHDLNDNTSAIDMYRAVLAVAPGDPLALASLAELYAKEERLPELLGLKRQELAHEKDEDNALALRLEIASLIDRIDRVGGRLELLRNNLKEVPGHRPTIGALTALLTDTGKYRQLSALLSDQATQLENKSDLPRSAELWEQVATICERELSDIDASLAAFRKVANLAPNINALDSLARLYTDRDQSAAAIPWLEQALGIVDSEERPGFVKRLATAHLAAGHKKEAIACLKEATAGDAPVVDLRLMLADIYRADKKWQPLAETLTAALPYIEDQEQLAAAAREAADTYHENLGQPAKALPALTRALELVPDDKSLRLMMAQSKRVVGLRSPESPELGEARVILEALIEDFGRRRSKERAAVHVELAQVARAEAKLEEAKSELELASKMDAGNSHILRALADLAREQGDLDQAERSLRALLLIVRRQPPGDDELAVGISEVLFELHHIAAVRDDEEKSEELLESVIEAASASDAEVRRLRRTLLDHNEFELLARVLRARIEVSEDLESKAGLLEHLAALLEQELDDPKASFEARLEALAFLPMNADLHDTTRVLSGQLGQVERYLERLEELVQQQRRAEESDITYSLLMRAGQVAESELNDLDRARAHYSAAEECKDNPADALFALARVCAAQGDVNEQARALDDLTNLAVADGPVLAQADALYRLAELQVAQPDLVERGLGLLRKAIEIEPRYRQAALTLQAAANSTDNAEEVLEQYEKAARQSGDRNILLDYLSRCAKQGDDDAVREAVNLANEIGEEERAIALLEEAVARATESEDGLGATAWASIELAKNYCAASRLEDAKELLFASAHLAQPDELLRLGLDIATRAIEDEERPMAARVLEFLRERDPNNREVWFPLLGIYREMGAGSHLVNLVDATLPSLVEPRERNMLRLEKGRQLVKEEQDEQAIDVLREALLEDPDCREAASLLEEVLRKEGHEEALSEFLWMRFQESVERGNVDTITDVACRLGNLLDSIGGDSLAVFQQALQYAPERRELLEGLLARLGDDSDANERAALTERLIAQEDGERAAELAMSLVELRNSLGDSDGVQRALELGLSASPEHAGLREHLESWYRESDQYGPLAQMKISQAESARDTATKIALLREAAALHRDQLGDFFGCTSILAQAQELAPDNDGLCSELAAAYAASGQTDKAIDAIARSLEHIEDASALPLLLMRSDLLRNMQRFGEAIQNLERALPLDRELVGPMLLQALEASRVAAQSTGDSDVERAMTMRLIEIYDEQGDEEGARGMLLTWIERDTQDIDALRRLRDMDKAAERWEGVVAACTHLVGLQQGEEQAQDALLLAEAALHIGAFDHARAGLERAHDDQPGNTALRERLRELYEQIGAHRELASLLLADAQDIDDENARYEKYRAAASIFVNELGDAEAAIEPAQRAKELRPEDHGTVVLLADVLVGSGKLDEAIDMLDPAIAAHKRRSPELAELQHRMAKVSAARGDQEEQLNWLKKAFDVDRKDGLIASELAHLATELGDYDLALKPLRAITLMENPAPVSRVMALLWEAKIEHARGNRAKAELWAKKALREDPEYAEAEDFLAQIAE